jgi:hypothetical protein
LVLPGRRPRGFFRCPSPLLLAWGWEERLGRGRRRRDGGQRRRLRARRREEGMEQAVPGDEDDAAARAGVQQDEGRGDARATVADDDEGVMSTWLLFGSVPACNFNVVFFISVSTSFVFLSLRKLAATLE